jgi:hypothetical protein
MYHQKQGLSEHKHCDNAATNANSENTRSRMEACSAGKRGYLANEDESSTGSVWDAGFHNATLCSRMARVLILLQQFISLIFTFLGRAVLSPVY